MRARDKNTPERLITGFDASGAPDTGLDVLPMIKLWADSHEYITEHTSSKASKTKQKSIIV